MSKLLIHNNNTTFNITKYFPVSEQFVFDIDLDKDVDFYIEENLADGELKRQLEEADIVFIKVSLSQNYLEYIGLRLGYHIRLTKSLGDKANIPIIFIAEESIQFLGLTYPEPSILFTKGIYLMRETIEDYEKNLKAYNKGNIKQLNNYDDFIKAIQINPPANYQSHHSIANEWSILRWAKVLDIPLDNRHLQGIKKNIENLLYYKFLLAKYPIQGEPNKANFKIQGKGKILLIDDEWGKGWNAVFSEFISISPELKNGFGIFEYDFKDKETDLIIKDCENIVIKTNPDIVILDLRLADSDFETNTKTQNLTGLKVLQAIKKFNPGIRVIIFTASNKVWNLLELQDAGANDFILKESPELGVSKDFTKETVENFALVIQEQLKYQFQKELFVKCKRIKTQLILQDADENKKYNDFLKTSIKQIDIIHSSIRLINLKEPKTLDIVFLTCYNFLELFNKYYLVYNKRDYNYYLGFDGLDVNHYEADSKKVIKNKGFRPKNPSDSPSWFVTQAALFIDYFQVSVPPYLEVINLRNIATKRNDYIHSTKTSFTVDELELIIESMSKACEKLRE